MFKNIGKNLILKKQTADDRDFLLSLYSSTKEDELNMTTMRPLEKKRFLKQQFELRALDYSKKFSDAGFLIIYRKKSPIGRIVYSIGADIHLIDIAFAKRSRGRGFGSLLIGHLIQSADDLKKLFRLSVATDNMRAIKLYQKLGGGDYSRGEWLF
jgi:ribosomal protein S18 acetylase RimI-like enzyme